MFLCAIILAKHYEHFIWNILNLRKINYPRLPSEYVSLLLFRLELNFCIIYNISEYDGQWKKRIKNDWRIHLYYVYVPLNYTNIQVENLWFDKSKNIPK